MVQSAAAIWTIGHSTRSIEVFLEMLRSFEIGALADVRRFPGSRRHPQFNAEPLAQTLRANAIEYLHFPELGGRRKPLKDSPNTAWRNEAFRGYADYMMSGEFRSGIHRLLSVAAEKRLAVMCAEAIWWQCHRALIADYLKTAGIEVWHITGPGKAGSHPYTSAARVVEGRLTYTTPSSALEFPF